MINETYEDGSPSRTWVKEADEHKLTEQQKVLVRRFSSLENEIQHWDLAGDDVPHYIEERKKQLNEVARELGL